MLRSMFSGVSGLRSHQTMMDVVGNNIANVNTAGYKSSRVTFQDTLSQLQRGGNSGGPDTGGVNPQQVGLGVRVGAIDAVNTQGAIQTTGRSTDVAIQGEGYFVVRSGTEQLYTRAGAFGFDEGGRLTDPTGYLVQGYLTGPDGRVDVNGPLQDVVLPLGQAIPPTPTSTVTAGGNLSAAATNAVVTPIEVFDGVGSPHTLTITYTPGATAGDGSRTWNVSVSEKDVAGVLGTGTVRFGSNGVRDAGTPPITFRRPGNGGGTVTLDLGTPGSPQALTQFGGATSASALGQDGAATGYLRSFSISDDGTVSGVFSNGASKPLAQLALATFSNPGGLMKEGDNHLRADNNSGLAQIGTPNTVGKGKLAAGALEMSNVDLAQEFTNLIVAQRGFQANSRIITASDELLQDLVNLKR